MTGLKTVWHQELGNLGDFAALLLWGNFGKLGTPGPHNMEKFSKCPLTDIRKSVFRKRVKKQTAVK